jgi:hypothetical protein
MTNTTRITLYKRRVIKPVSEGKRHGLFKTIHQHSCSQNKIMKTTMGVANRKAEIPTEYLINKNHAVFLN